jgi:hypothetical protein
MDENVWKIFFQLTSIVGKAVTIVLDVGGTEFWPFKWHYSSIFLPFSPSTCRKM